MEKKTKKTTSNSKSKKSATGKNNSSATRRISTVSDETKMYKIDKDELEKAQKSKSSKKNINSKGNRTKGKKKKKKQNKAWRIIKKIIIAIVILGILALLILAGIIAGIFLGFFGDDFKMTKDDLVIQFVNSEVYDSDGNLLCTLTGNEQRKIVSLEDMPELLPKAYVAIEDERFYEHSGVDIKRTGAATITYILNGGSSSFGGSTITQQLVKNITDEDEDSALRKVKEMARAIQIEKEVSKDNILELYLNIIFVGGNNVNGVALGAEYYFDKDVSELDLAECAFMAGINHSPNSYNPFVSDEETRAENIARGQSRAKTVLAKMLELGYIDQEQYDSAVSEVDAGFNFKQGDLSGDTIYTAIVEEAIDQVVEQLMEEKGMSQDMAETKVYGGGYKIYTTQVTSIQSTIEEEMQKDKYSISGVAKNSDGTLVNEHSQAAMVVIDHTTGQVVGCVGQLGEKTTNFGLDRATQSYRQVGSSMKPLAVIAPAVQEGIITAASVYDDSYTSEFSTDGSIWPKDYYSTPKGKMTVREAIEISGNIIPVRILNELGVSKSIEYLEKMNLTVSSDVGLSLALGSAEFSPLQIASAYATIANDGVYIEPTFYTKVLDSSGNVVLEPNQETAQVFGKSEAYIVKSILTEPVQGSSGTATYAKISGIDVAAKTGTTDDDYDRWLCGFTPYYTAACWYGYDINEEVKYSGSPSNPAGGIWSAVMSSIHSGLEAKTFSKPSDIVTVTICKDSGLLPSTGCTDKLEEVFIDGTQPTTYCSTGTTTKSYSICTDSGLLATDNCPNVEKKTFSATEAPTEYCTMHTAVSTPTPSTTTTSPSTSVSPSTSTSTSPTTSTATTSTSTPSTSTSPTPATSPTTSGGEDP